MKDAKGIDLKIADDAAPFGTGTVDTIDAPPCYRILNGAGHLVEFRMVLRVDNNCCRALIHPVTGAGLTVDADCGFIEYASGAAAGISFDAEHPHDFATFSLSTVRGAGMLRVFAGATDGHNRLSHLDRFNVAAFALATPCACP